MLALIAGFSPSCFSGIDIAVLRKCLRQLWDDFLISNIEVVNNRILISGKKEYKYFDKGSVEMVWVFHSNGDYAFCPDAENFNQKRNAFLGIN